MGSDNDQETAPLLQSGKAMLTILFAPAVSLWCAPLLATAPLPNSIANPLLFTSWNAPAYRYLL